MDWGFCGRPRVSGWGTFVSKDVAKSCRMWDWSCIAYQLEIKTTTFEGGALD